MLGFAFKPEPESRASGQDAKTGWGGGVGSLVLLLLVPVWSHQINLPSLIFTLIRLFSWPVAKSSSLGLPEPRLKASNTKYLLLQSISSHDWAFIAGGVLDDVISNMTAALLEAGSNNYYF